MHSPDCRGPYTPDQTSCYCGFCRYLYYERTVNHLMETLNVGWAYWGDSHDRAVEELKAVAVQLVAWKRFAAELLARIGDDPVSNTADMWFDEALPPTEILNRPDAICEITQRIANTKDW